MDELILPESGKIGLLLAPRPLRQELVTELAARLALVGPLRVLDCGNSFAAHALARHLRRRSAQITPLLQRIQVARAFTCYQVVTLLAETAAATASPPGAGWPVLVPELLSTFLDESLPLLNRRRLLQAALLHLQQLSRQGPVVISAGTASEGRFPGALLRNAAALRAAPPPDPTAGLLALLEQVAQLVWRFEPPDPPPAPLRLPGL